MKFDIIKTRNWWFALSLLILIPGIISMFTQGFNLGIDFTGGTILDLKFSKPVLVEQVRDALKEHGLENSVIQITSGHAEQGEGVMIRTKELNEEMRRVAFATMQQKLGDFELLRVEHVGAIIGSELTRDAIIAMVIASLLILVYVAFRFEWRFGVAGVAALVHDLLIVLGVFSLLHKEIDSTFIAALLTILGYSINDTIVVFDRVRENLKQMKKGDTFHEIANRSIWQTMTRSIYTVLTVLFAAVSLYVFGGETTKNFAFALIIGIGIGCYSSIFNATPIWTLFKEAEQNKKKTVAATK